MFKNYNEDAYWEFSPDETEEGKAKFYDMKVDKIHSKAYNIFMNILDSDIGLRMWNRQWNKSHSDEQGYESFIARKSNSILKIFNIVSKFGGITTSFDVTVDDGNLFFNSHVSDKFDIYHNQTEL